MASRRSIRDAQLSGVDLDSSPKSEHKVAFEIDHVKTTLNPSDALTGSLLPPRTAPDIGTQRETAYFDHDAMETRSNASFVSMSSAFPLN